LALELAFGAEDEEEEEEEEDEAMELALCSRWT